MRFSSPGCRAVEVRDSYPDSETISGILGSGRSAGRVLGRRSEGVKHSSLLSQSPEKRNQGRLSEKGRLAWVLPDE